MKESHFERRLAENEVIFREANEKVRRDLAALSDAARRDGHLFMTKDDDHELFFFCECADSHCRERILMRPSEYHAAHGSSAHFVVLPGHNLPRIERIVQQTPKYLVVEKFMQPPSVEESTLHEV